MITSSNDCGDFIIATPTKCATTTIEAVAKRHMRQNPGEADQFRIMDWDSPRRQHRMALPPMVRDSAAGEMEVEYEGEDLSMGVAGDEDEWGAADRFLFVRNPFRRYMSIYTYLSAPANYSQWGAREIQGEEWGGHDASKVIDTPKMTFAQFLDWFIEKRHEWCGPASLGGRGDLRDGRAYRSPWVWLDSLTDSFDFLVSQPGPAAGEAGLLRMEDLWEDLALLKEEYELEYLDLSPTIHANRSTGYGQDGPDPGSREFWGGIRCSRSVFRKRVWQPDAVKVDAGCECQCCRLGVAAEAIGMGYV